MYNFIKQVQGHSFSDKEIMKLVDKKAKLVIYPQLKYITNIDKIFKNDCCVLLYLQEPNYGHWTCLIRNRKKKIIYFFDPYGYPPDAQLGFITEAKNINLGQNVPYLTQLLEKSKYNVVYSPKRLQKLSNNNNVCGRWVGMRLQFKELTNEQFANMFVNKKNCYDGDWLVTAMTCFIN